MAPINAGLTKECGFIWTFVIAFFQCVLNLFFLASVKIIEECNLNKKRKVLIVFDDMIAGTLSNKIIKPIVIELFIRGTKPKISPGFITQPYFPVSKNIRINSTHYLIIKFPNKRERQQIVFNHSSYIEFQDYEFLQKLNSQAMLFSSD